MARRCRPVLLRFPWLPESSPSHPSINTSLVQIVIVERGLWINDSRDPHSGVKNFLKLPSEKSKFAFKWKPFSSVLHTGPAWCKHQRWPCQQPGKQSSKRQMGWASLCCTRASAASARLQHRTMLCAWCGAPRPPLPLLGRVTWTQVTHRLLYWPISINAPQEPQPHVHWCPCPC